MAPGGTGEPWPPAPTVPADNAVPVSDQLQTPGGMGIVPGGTGLIKTDVLTQLISAVIAGVAPIARGRLLVVSSLEGLLGVETRLPPPLGPQSLRILYTIFHGGGPVVGQWSLFQELPGEIHHYLRGT